MDRIEKEIQGIIDSEFSKWGCDPAYLWDDPECGETAKNSSYLIETLETYLCKRNNEKYIRSLNDDDKWN